jgi:hypothetical protein
VSGARRSRATSIDVEPVADRSLKALLSHTMKALLSHTITGCRKPTSLSIYAQPVFTAHTALAQFAILEATTTI